MGRRGDGPDLGARPERRHWLLIAAVTAAGVVKARFEWIPVWYLAVVIVAPVVVAHALRCRRGRPLWRWVQACSASTVAVALCPVPWTIAAGEGAPGNAWRLDGRISIEHHTIDPAGEWYWLTVGRPVTVGELVWSKIEGGDAAPTMSMRSGALRARPRWAEPAAAAVGLSRAGWAVAFTEQATVIVPTVDGEPIEVVVGGWLAGTPAGKWYRNLSTGSSHGLMVALVAYADASGDQLGRGLAVAGTGTINPDGEVGRIRGLFAKATAARGAGASVLLFPASQVDQLEGFDSRGMQLIGVETIDDAIAALHAIQASRRAGTIKS